MNSEPLLEKNKSAVFKALCKFSKKMPPMSFGEELTNFKIDMAKQNMSSFTKFCIADHKRKNINDFLKSYNNVRKCDDSWPECNSLNDWYALPENIKKECFYKHKFSPDHYIKDSRDKNFFDPTIESLLLTDPDFHPDVFYITGYTIDQLCRTKNVIYENIDYLINSNIVEFAAGDALLSASAINMGVKSSVVTDISDYNLIICQKTKKIMNYDNDMLSVRKSDITSQNEVKNICYNKDAALVISILTLISDKYDVLKNIALVKPKYIIISELLDPTSFYEENDQDAPTKQEIDEIIQSPIPAIQYVNVNCKKSQSILWSQLNPENFENIHKNSTTTLSIPNIAWYNFTMKDLGYSKIKFHRWNSNINNININERFTAVYELT